MASALPPSFRSARVSAPLLLVKGAAEIDVVRDK
jgi:hypothetical protein